MLVNTRSVKIPECRVSQLLAPPLFRHPMRLPLDCCKPFIELGMVALRSSMRMDTMPMPSPVDLIWSSELPEEKIAFSQHPLRSPHLLLLS